MSNSYCSKFKQKLEEMRGELGEIKPGYLEDLLYKYKATGDKNIEEKLDKINKILQKIEEFKKEYKEKVMELLREWYQNYTNKFLPNLKINEKGRVEIEELDVNYCLLPGSFYLPSLFEKIKVLMCNNNYLSSLPRLPEGLKELKCNNNQLTSLPELPDELKVFWGMDNPFSFSSETIKRIKSHPNYDPHYWLL